ncbi:MAG: hypothetical protein KDD48_05980 [Bdellovibrionales bacterium]|nr:hypothetical protein [Bdellovibrionales bacterium]
MKKKNHLNGQGMTEYIVIIGIIAVSSIAIVRTTSSSLKVGFGKIASALQGSSYQGAKAEKVTSTKTKGKSMNDFDQGATN